jgi:hypothetical protein
MLVNDGPRTITLAFSGTNQHAGPAERVQA